MLSRRAANAFLVTAAIASLAAEIHANNVCYVEQGGCRYRITVLPTSVCPAISGYSHNNDQPVDGDESPPTSTVDGVPESKTATTVTAGGLGSGFDTPFDAVKKLETLELKLLKMVEELSVRSLRHIREIRSDLRQMAVSVNSLKASTGGSRTMTTRSGGTLGGSLVGGVGGGKDMLNSQALVGGRGAGTRCPSEFLGVGTWRSCYRFSNFEATWHEAREYCSAFGANLVSIDTMKEAYIVDYLIKSYPGMLQVHQ
jgi:hypothetical protein